MQLALNLVTKRLFLTNSLKEFSNP